MDTVLLPGMDGTGELFARYLRHDPRAVPVRYPDEPLGYADLHRWLRPRLPAGPFVLVAESFSGPLALLVGADPPPGLRGLVLVATFARNPTPLPRGTPVPPLPLPRWLLARALTDEPALLDAVVATLARVPRPVLARRAREILAVDARPALAACAVPTLRVRGARDRLVGARAAAELGPHHTLDAPHLVLQSAPRAAADLVRAFVEGR